MIKYVCKPFDLPLTKTQEIVGTWGPCAPRQLWLGSPLFNRYDPILRLELPVHLKRQQTKSVKCDALEKEAFVAYNSASHLL